MEAKERTTPAMVFDPDATKQNPSTMIFGTSSFDSSIFKQINSQERARNFDNSDFVLTEEEYQLPHNHGGYIEKMITTYLDQKAKKVDHKYLLYLVTMKKNSNGKDLGIIML